jgi:hypothetical protein
MKTYLPRFMNDAMTAHVLQKSRGLPCQLVVHHDSKKKLKLHIYSGLALRTAVSTASFHPEMLV